MENSFLMVSEEAMRGEIERNTGWVEASRPENGGGRRKSRSNAAQKKKKNPPQRGMGVAKLERLRWEESYWKKKTETEKIPLRSLNNLHPSPPSYSFPDPMAASMVGGGGQLGFGLNQALLVQNGLFSDGFGANPYGFGAVDPGLRVGHELSSIPNVVGFYPGDDHCGICHKKKRVNGETFGCNAMREKCDADPYLSNGCSFLGSNPGNNGNMGGEKKEHFSINVDQGVDVMGFHKKGSSGVIREYEFFPAGKDGRGTPTKDLLESGLFSSEASVSVCGGVGGGGGGEGSSSCVTTTTTPTSSTGFVDASTTSVDLSLKLSF